MTAGTLMAIGAHAGDVENTAAAAVLKHTRAGHRAVVVHLTLGEAGNPKLARELYAAQRQREVAESAAIMGAEMVWFPYPDGTLPVTEEIQLRLCDLIRKETPAVILTHWKGSFHQDHVATHELVLGAVRLAATASVVRDLPPHRVRSIYYPENWEDMEGWHPDVYLDVTDVWDEVVRVLRSHEFIRGGISRFRYLDYYTALGTMRGCLAGFDKAVALMVPGGRPVRRVSVLPVLEPEPRPA